MSSSVTTRTSQRAPDLDTAAGLLRFGNLFCDAKVLLTAVQLGLFNLLEERPATESEIRDRLGLHGRGLSDFLRVLVALGVVIEFQGFYRNSCGAENHLVSGAPGYIGGFLLGADATLYPAYANLAQALRTGRPQTGGEFTDMLDDPAMLSQFLGMMDGLSETLGPRLATAFEWPGYRSVLDIGGCRGNLTGHLLAAHPHLSGHIFDLPQLEPFFDDRIAELGLIGRARFHPGDFFRDELPPAEVMIYGHVLSDWDPEQRALLLSKAFAALAPGGALLVYDRMLHPGDYDIENLVASLNMLLVTERGGEYTVAELADQAVAVGFTSITHTPLGAYDTLMTCAKKPSAEK